jgi:hypothetical protein
MVCFAEELERQIERMKEEDAIKTHAHNTIIAEQQQRIDSLSQVRAQT